MEPFAAILREARESAGLGVDALARVLDLPADEIGGYENDRPVPQQVLERYATTFGTPFGDFLEGAAARAPATLLFRSAAQHGADLGELLQGSDLRVLGDFLVCVSEVADIEARLSHAHQGADANLRAPDIAEPEWEQGRELALALRRELGLRNDPIDSMLELLRGHFDVLLFFVEPGQLDAAVQGASTLVPRPAILVNLIGGRRAWWSTRVSLAHELCHLLFDFRGRAQPYLVSPPGSGDWRLVDRFRGIERRANAFAVHLLVPGEGLRQLVGDAAPDSDHIIDAVCRHFGVGRTVAIRRLGQEYHLTQSWQDRKLQVQGDDHDDEHPDADIPVGLRAGVVRTWVERAFAQGVLDGLEARSILNIPIHQPLEIDDILLEPPLISEEQAARTKAEAFVYESGYRDPCSEAARRTDTGWTVDVRCVQVEPHARLTKVVRLSPEFELLGS